MTKINFGPLTQLIGVWKGDKGTDIAPEPSGQANNPYFETITFEIVGDVSNAETQTLAVLHYKQIVQRAENGEVFHHQVGYWSWDAATGVITHSFTIPRGVGVVACGKVNEAGNVIEVSTNAEGGITQSAFMEHNAKTTAFSQVFTTEGDRLSYKQAIMLNIYGKTFEHTDSNTLVRSQ
ncbi:MAG: heme-binding beta-barrel domain-containing protein [Mariprofundaceae bacterium]|nr:heme-binding beta-barrel domain-containing protein [Mariprofundaceae bacterium]